MCVLKGWIEDCSYLVVLCHTYPEIGVREKEKRETEERKSQVDQAREIAITYK